MSEFIAVDQGLSTGTITFWRNTAGTRYARLREEWETQGLPAKLLPKEVSPSQALNRAMNDQEFNQGSKRYFVKNVARMTWHMVCQDKSQAGEAKYTPILKGTILAGVPVVTVVSEDPTHEELAVKMIAAISLAYTDHLTVFGAADLGIWLTSLVETQGNATSLKKGGFYFVPAKNEEFARKVDAALSAASGNDSHLCFIPAMRCADTTRAVMEGLEAMALKAMGEIEEFIGTNADPQDRSIRLRSEELDAIKAKIAEYSGIFQVPLDAMQDKLFALKNKLHGVKVKLDGAAEGRDVSDGARVLELDNKETPVNNDAAVLDGERKLELD